jgi:hypothetical protein
LLEADEVPSSPFAVDGRGADPLSISVSIDFDLIGKGFGESVSSETKSGTSSGRTFFTRFTVIVVLSEALVIPARDESVLSIATTASTSSR